jgi:autotransporter family porin
VRTSRFGGLLVGRSHHRGRIPSARTLRRAKLARIKPQGRRILPRLGCADRRALLAGTALASTLLLGTLFAPTPAQAVACVQPASPAPINDFSATDPIICVNTEPRNAILGDPAAIFLQTTGAGHFIDLYNSGTLTGTGLGARGIGAFAGGPDASVTVVNVGDITTDGQQAYGINAVTGIGPNVFAGDGGPGGVAAGGAGGAGGGDGGNANADGALGLAGFNGSSGDITIINAGDITTLGLFADGIKATAAVGGGYGGDGGNGGTATGGAGGAGDGLGGNGGNGGSASADGGDGGAGYGGDGGDILIINNANVATLGNSAAGLYATTFGGAAFAGEAGNGGNAIGGVGGAGAVGNGGNGGSASASGGAGGTAFGGNAGDITIINNSDIATFGLEAHGIHVRAFAQAGVGYGTGVGGASTGGAGDDAGADGNGGNGGDASANGGAGGNAFGGEGGDVNITNYGQIATSANYSHGIFINSYGGQGIGSPGPNGGAATGGTGGVGGTLGGEGGDGGDASSDGGTGGDGNGGDGGEISIINNGDVATSGLYADGINARSFAGAGRGDVAPGGNGGASTGGYGGAGADGDGGDGGDAQADAGDGGDGNGGNGGAVSIVNNGSVGTSGDFSRGIYASSGAGGGDGGTGGNGGATTGRDGGAGGIAGDGGDGGSSSSNGGTGGFGFGGDGGDITITNNGSVVTSGDYSHGIYALARGGFGAGGNGGNGGAATGGDGGAGATGDGGDGGSASADGGDGGAGYGGDGGDITIVNAGDVHTSGFSAHGIYAKTIAGIATNGAAGSNGAATGGAGGAGANGGNGGSASALGGAGGQGIGGDSGSITIDNSGWVSASGNAARAVVGSGSGTILVDNSGTLFGGTAGVYVSSPNPTTIINSGYLSSQSLLAIHSYGPGSAQIFNSGLITGYVILDADDRMVNQSDGMFEARLTSDFGPGEDLFENKGTVHAVAVGADQPSFVNLERFENSGLISLVDGNEGDIFQISNTVGGTDLAFAASNGSTLAVDAFLGGPGSTADNFVIDGNVSGKTAVTINNTNPAPGVFNPQGIPVVFVNGDVKGDAFFMPQPIDTGLFDWDLFFVPTGSGFFELRSFPGGGAHVLPQLLTAAQDVFHTTNETWFDRTADLRVLLNGGAAYGVNGGKLDGAPVAFTPGVWLKGSGTWLEQEDSAKTSAYGRTYRYNLNRDLDVANFEGGIDFGKKGVWSEGDALVFGVLGGVVLGSLDYDQLIRQFDIEGGEVGGYATYLSGGLFVDTLVKVDFLEFDTQGAPGLPGTLDATTWGFRTDAGYRFGGFRRGPFIEPLATIAVAWSEIDDFTLGGNAVKFNDEADVRGRLGLRVGTSREVWSGIVMEPFVIGSVWGHLSGDNKVTVTSLGTTFRLEDEPDDVWGVASAGVNFFSPGASTSLFAKLDVTFGEETEGVSAKGGMRYNW